MTALRFIQIAIGAPASAGFDASFVPPFCLAFLLSTALLHGAIHRLRSRATVVGHANADRH